MPPEDATDKGTLNAEAGASSDLAQNPPDVFETVVRPQQISKEPPSGHQQDKDKPGKSSEGEEDIAGQDATKKAKEGDDSSPDDRLDHHPRFKEVIEKNQRLEAELREIKQKLESLGEPQKQDKPSGEAAQQQPAKKYFEYEDITEMKPDAALDKFSENPIEFLSNFASQVADEVLSYVDKLLEQRELTKKQESEIDRTYAKFAEEHPDFIEKWDSGEIKAYMKKHPGHTAMSAYLMITKEAREKAIEEQVKAKLQKDLAAAAEAKQRELAAKAKARTLGAGGLGAGLLKPDDDLKNTASRGGLVNTIAEKLRQMRQAQ